MLEQARDANVLIAEYHARTDRYPIVQIDNVIVHKADTAETEKIANGLWRSNAVNARASIVKVDEARAEGIAGPPGKKPGEASLRRTRPAGVCHSGHSTLLDASVALSRPRKACYADPVAVL